MKLKTITSTVSALVVASGCAGALMAAPPFGGEEDVAYSQDLWAELESANYVGDNAIMSVPYKGQHPHGAVLDTIDGELTVAGHTGTVIVKRNYGGEGVDTSKVANDPGKYLGAITVMFRREPGYDANNANWFWVKYLPDGTLDKNPKGMPLAGRVAKGMNQGCIACHQAAPGGDYVYNNDRF